MSSTSYKGWKVPEEIIIVSKVCTDWDSKNCCTVILDEMQGYVVEPGNESMLQSAHYWAKWTEYGEYDKTTRKYAKQIEHDGVEHRFTNDGFTLELLECANSSSQGGKLSFWNCKVSKDGKSFIVGIASDYLLEILLHNVFIKGVCQTTLSFARCKGGVGMLNKSMPSYQQFLLDEEQRKAVNKGKTKKREPGHVYRTLTEGNVFFGTYYRWYEPVYDENYFYHYNRNIIGYKRLDKPIAQYWQPWYDERFTKKSEYFNSGFYWSDKIPARADYGIVAEIDMTDEEVLEKHLKNVFKEDAEKWAASCVGLNIGVTTDKDNYELPEYIRSWVVSRGLKIWD